MILSFHDCSTNQAGCRLKMRYQMGTTFAGVVPLGQLPAYNFNSFFIQQCTMYNARPTW